MDPMPCTIFGDIVGWWHPLIFSKHKTTQEKRQQCTARVLRFCVPYTRLCIALGKQDVMDWRLAINSRFVKLGINYSMSAERAFQVLIQFCVSPWACTFMLFAAVLLSVCPCQWASTCDYSFSLLMQFLSIWYKLLWFSRMFPFIDQIALLISCPTHVQYGHQLFGTQSVDWPTFIISTYNWLAFNFIYFTLARSVCNCDSFA